MFSYKICMFFINQSIYTSEKALYFVYYLYVYLYKYTYTFLYKSWNINYIY